MSRWAWVIIGVFCGGGRCLGLGLCLRLRLEAVVERLCLRKPCFLRLDKVRHTGLERLAADTGTFTGLFPCVAGGSFGVGFKVKAGHSPWKKERPLLAVLLVTSHHTTPAPRRKQSLCVEL